MTTIIKYMISDACNGTCQYCPYKEQLFQKTMRQDEIALSFDVLWNLHDGFDCIHLFGGEATLYPHLIECIDSYSTQWCRKREKPLPLIALSTNLLKLNKTIIKFLNKNKSRLAIITSIDGTQEFHDKHRMPDSYGIIHANVCILKDMGIKLYNITTVYHAQFLRASMSPFDLALELVRSFDPRSLTFNIILSEDPDLMLSPEAFYEAQLEATEQACQNLHCDNPDYRKAAMLILQPLLLDAKQRNDYFCNYGIDSITVFPDGDIDTCPDIYLYRKMPRLNMRTPDFEDQYIKFLQTTRVSNSRAHFKDCHSCLETAHCTICPYWDIKRKHLHCDFLRRRRAIMNQCLSPSPAVPVVATG